MQNTANLNKVFFPNLNGVRAVAALMVIVQHIELVKSWFGFTNCYHDNPMGIDFGGLGVTLFFVLSGFLITFLLLTEKSVTGTVSLRDFYIRRVLRIWPLYYLIVVLAFFAIPCFYTSLAETLSRDFSSKLLLFVFFLPNVALVAYPPVYFAAQAWSVGVEEQFYLIWPLLIKHCRNLPLILLGIVGLFFITNGALYCMSAYADPGPAAKHSIKIMRDLVLWTRIDCMAIGGLGAYILFNSKRMILNILYSRMVQAVTYGTVVVLGYNQVSFPFLNHSPYALLFAILLLNLAANPDTVLSLNNRLFDYLGKISYGLYMYHMLAIMAVVYTIANRLDIRPPLYLNVVIYVASIGLVIAISSLSYECYEKFFLRQKIRFSAIVSGDNSFIEPAKYE